MKQVIVIGGGPAGMMAAISAGSAGHKVLLLEQNEKLGKKLYITGKGRGNFTNSADISDFFDKIIHNPSFLYSALYGFSNRALLSFFEENGLKWKEERGGRIFPLSDHASDITKALTRALHHSQIEIRTDSKVMALINDGSRRVCQVKTSDGEYIACDHVIVATGGLSYPSTGSTGDGLLFARDLGLKVVDPLPALVPLETIEPDIPGMQGLSLKNVSLSVSDNRKILYEGFGELLFTHFGISGPLALSASSHITKRLSGSSTLAGTIDLKPAITTEELDKRLIRQADSMGSRNFSRFFEGILPKKLQPVIIDRSGIDPSSKIAALSKAQRSRILTLLKGFSFTISKTRGFSEAIITQGGVSVKELDPRNMRAKSFEGLSFAGEVIDVDALTGGFNLQIAFSTGYLAGMGV